MSPSNTTLKTTFILFLTFLFALTIDAQPFTFQGKWGTPGSGDGQFSFPAGVATDAAGNVFIADNSNNRIQKFNNSGAFLGKWGTPGSGDGQFYYPAGVATDAAGNVFIADRYNHRIQKFSDGSFAPAIPTLGQWGLMVLALLLLIIGTVAVRRFQSPVASSQ